ncbi:transcriptional regulator ArgP [Jannaschia pagri]|uniref:Transcriptional regulator ArgP n=1 Tax=Jannaschia pagri TaxID=2829797 RepID=A0ABQ4NJ03_9RHOB|nr:MULTISPECIES: ArgP/LysG family DNA-binding transcriptional regulator [unclassified Jannaschia]GIT90552.1 transcriptional regulator ArgP [Jannaschia sp. AI_61]GIT94384.1 transcriptional regulator ArgP [Jannaschia sp. AI_62]
MFAPALLRTLVAVCETGSFDLAAAQLGVTPPAVSQRMRALAEAAGGSIFARLQPAEPTALGLRLLRHARDVAALQADLAADLGQDSGPRPVSVAINADSLEAWAVPALAEAPGFRLDVQVLDQDHSAAVLRRGEVSAALTSEAEALPGCDVHRLGALRYLACCTPAFHARYFAEGVTAQALDRAPMLQFSEMDGLQARWARSLTGHHPHGPVHRVPAPGPFLQATRLGMGWGTNPEGLIEVDLARGTLVPLVPERPLDTPLYWQVSRIMAPVLAPLTEAMRRHARRALRQAA